MTKGRWLKWMNATISASFVIPAVAALLHWHPSILTWLIASPVAILWANWFEYAYHRWLDHEPGSRFEREHRKHHAQPNNEEFHNLGDNPLVTMGMFVVNWTPVLIADLFLKIGFSAPVLFAFVLYVLVMEEVHWRIHENEWVPEAWRRYHYGHHGIGQGATGGRSKYNIFLPIFDWLFGTLA
jgi:hypothetical protein